VQEEEVHKDLKSVVTSFVNSTKGVDISTTTYMEENNYLAAKIEEVDEEDESTTVAECTLDKDEYVCEEIVKDENNKITDKTVRTSSVSVHRIKTDAFTVDDYPLLLTTKRESTDYDADEKVTDVTIVEYTYNDQKLEVTSVDDDTENVGEDDEEQTVDESETTYDNDGRRPLETVTKRTKGEGKPYETKVEYEY
jgi:hypothetical protein